MNDNVARTLTQLLAEHGLGIARDPARCEELLRGVCKGQKQEVFLLITALRQGVVSALMQADRGSVESVVGRLGKKLHKELALLEPAAVWAVNAWAGAIGLCGTVVKPPVSIVPVERVPPIVAEDDDDESSSGVWCAFCRAEMEARGPGNVVCDYCGMAAVLGDEREVISHTPIAECDTCNKFYLVRSDSPFCGRCGVRVGSHNTASVEVEWGENSHVLASEEEEDLEDDAEEWGDDPDTWGDEFHSRASDIEDLEVYAAERGLDLSITWDAADEYFCLTDLGGRPTRRMGQDIDEARRYIRRLARRPGRPPG